MQNKLIQLGDFCVNQSPALLLRSHLRFLLVICIVSVPGYCQTQLCASCHPKEVAGYAQSGMSHSMAVAGAQPDGQFEQTSSGTTFRSVNRSGGVWQSLERSNETQQLHTAYAIGSGHHAFGYLAEIDHHLFQSPLSYYTQRHAWDVAPGYEQAPHPDFSRPVSMECLTCHSEKPRPVANTLNTYQSPPFTGMSIECDRCHGSAAAHLKNPVPGSILNPAKLTLAARDSVCEQCHLAGEIRIPNPGKSIADFKPGEPLENTYTVYVSAEASTGSQIKVISHSEQLRLSTCARRSSGKLWCGTCHNPHEKPAEPVTYYRQRCLTCHASTLPAEHAAPDSDCIGCHMPKRGAKDGGHTAFTDHRIARRPIPEGTLSIAADLTAWREPAPTLAERNLALALATNGLQNSIPDQAIRGYKMLSRMEPSLWNDPAALTVLGNVLLTAKQPVEAERRFARALSLRPGYAPYEVNLASALLAQGDLKNAHEHAERALQLDHLLAQAVNLLNQIYRAQGENIKAEDLLARYRASMGIVMDKKQ
ncbi:MAG TPA: hypothetical protein VHZ55_06530 [Bryobacteraceae bacterium]|nr:hypothetical protein [Bryobacteraceae bacterium]